MHQQNMKSGHNQHPSLNNVSHSYIGIGLYNVKHLTFNKYAIEHHDTTYPLLVVSSNLKL